MITQGHHPSPPSKPSAPTGHKPTPGHPGHGNPGPGHKPPASKPPSHKPPGPKKPTKPDPPKKSAAVWELDLSETPDPMRGLKEGGHIH